MPPELPTPEPPAYDLDAQSSRLSSLEISGAVCARIIHDLSNLTSGILGNAEYAQTAQDPEGIRKAIQAISVSADNAGKLLGQCLPLQRFISNEAVPCDTAELALVIAESSMIAPGWLVAEPRPLTGRARVQSRWLTAAVWQTVLETKVERGEIEFACGPAVFPVVWHAVNPIGSRAPELFQITLRYRADYPIFTSDGPTDPERLGALAAHELIRRFKGQIHARPRPPGRQEISILLPLF